jgi:hypothetical protein
MQVAELCAIIVSFWEMKIYYINMYLFSYFFPILTLSNKEHMIMLTRACYGFSVT